MYTVLVIIIVIASIFLTFAVLLQNSKGGGLAANFTAGNQAFGVRQTADFLEKATWTLAGVVIVCCILATAAVSSRQVETKTDLTKELQKSVPTSTTPAFPATTTEETPAEEPAK